MRITIAVKMSLLRTETRTYDADHISIMKGQAVLTSKAKDKPFIIPVSAIREIES